MQSRQSREYNIQPRLCGIKDKGVKQNAEKETYHENDQNDIKVAPWIETIFPSDIQCVINTQVYRNRLRQAA